MAAFEASDKFIKLFAERFNKEYQMAIMRPNHTDTMKMLSNLYDEAAMMGDHNKTRHIQEMMAKEEERYRHEMDYSHPPLEDWASDRARAAYKDLNQPPKNFPPLFPKDKIQEKSANMIIIDDPVVQADPLRQVSADGRTQEEIEDRIKFEVLALVGDMSAGGVEWKMGIFDNPKEAQEFIGMKKVERPFKVSKVEWFIKRTFSEGGITVIDKSEWVAPTSPHNWQKNLLEIGDGPVLVSLHGRMEDEQRKTYGRSPADPILPNQNAAQSRDERAAKIFNGGYAKQADLALTKEIYGGGYTRQTLAKQVMFKGLPHCFITHYCFWEERVNFWTGNPTSPPQGRLTPLFELRKGGAITEIKVSETLTVQFQSNKLSDCIQFDGN